MDISYYKQFEPIDGKWYITKRLGSGSFGTVFEVERKDYGSMKSALKVITIPSSQSEIDTFRSENYDLDEKSITSYFYGFVEEFIKEFQLMAEMRGHSNIVSYEDHDIKEHKDGIGWDIFIRMELLTPLNDYYAQNSPVQEDIIKLGIDICKALEVCYKNKIIHRDIKPSNIFMSKTGDYKLGDFGVARTLEKTSSGLSKKGTYTYMAPEVYKGEPYGVNVDIYSLGIVMYRLLNNNLEPFRTDRTFSNGEEALVKRLKGEEMPAPANAEGKLADVILKACAYNSRERYQTPSELREALEDILYITRRERLNSEIPTRKSVSNANEVKVETEIHYDEEDYHRDGTVSLFGNSNGVFPSSKVDNDSGIVEQTSIPNVEFKFSGLAEMFPEWCEMIAELDDSEILERINNVEEWSDDYRTLCKEEYYKRTGSIITDASEVVRNEPVNRKKESNSYVNSGWAYDIGQLEDYELIERCQSEDEWQEEYLQLCYEEIKKRNISLNDDCQEEDAGDAEGLNYYEMTALNNLLSQLSETELADKRKQAEIILNNKSSTQKEKIIAEHIVYYCETLNEDDSETDLTVGIFE